MAKKTPKPEIEDALFREAIKDVARINHTQIEPFQKRLPPRPLLKRPSDLSDEDMGWSDPLTETEIKTEEVLYFARPGIQHRLMRDLSRGHLEIEETLDLHGLTTRYAHQELIRFLSFCHHRHIRCVRIIHGKGYGSANRQPVLKQRINVWLQQREDVLGFCSTPRRDGGTGAVYVLLSRRYHGRS